MNKSNTLYSTSKQALSLTVPVFADGYADITLGEDYTDLETTITVFNHRTNLDSEDYGGATWIEEVQYEAVEFKRIMGHDLR